MHCTPVHVHLVRMHSNHHKRELSTVDVDRNLASIRSDFESDRTHRPAGLDWCGFQRAMLIEFNSLLFLNKNLLYTMHTRSCAPCVCAQ